jgi:mannose-1-phosphate guanylyltransferase/mannose-1-phosphate guanylyltransferase/phosphomannomutase
MKKIKKVLFFLFLISYLWLRKLGVAPMHIDFSSFKRRMMQTMKAMIMAAGVGSRLMPLTATMPKPMAPIVGRPVMQYSVELLKRHGITDIIANLHYLPDIIRNHFKNGQDFGVKMEYSFEEKLLGTAGGVKNNQWFLDGNTFVILSGDALTDINLTEMYDFHKKKGALATIALKLVEDVTQFGVVALDENEKIKAFQEKPKKEDALSNLANTGIYIFEPEVFNYIPKNKFCDFGKELFPLLVENDMPFYGWETSAYWSDIGSFETYKEAQFDLINGKVGFIIRLHKYGNILEIF